MGWNAFCIATFQIAKAVEFATSKELPQLT
jgi:hypothetical protein